MNALIKHTVARYIQAIGEIKFVVTFCSSATYDMTCESAAHTLYIASNT